MSKTQVVGAGEVAVKLLQIVVLEVDGRRVALRVEDVVEIVRMVAVAPLVDAPHWMAGCLNARGTVVPVIDLRLRLALTPGAVNADQAICIVSAGGRLVGIVADEAQEVLTLPIESFGSPDELSGLDHPVSWIARSEDHRLIYVLDVERLCDGTEDLSLPDMVSHAEEGSDAA